MNNEDNILMIAGMTIIACAIGGFCLAVYVGDWRFLLMMLPLLLFWKPGRNP
jgi:hypothetical protein